MYGHRRFAPTVWNEMFRLNREMNRFFENQGGRRPAESAAVFPPVNLYDDNESLILRAEIPGVDPKEIDISATQDVVTIRGKREQGQLQGDVSYHRRERDHGVFSRSLSLPTPINPDKVMANYRLGVLEVVLPKAEETRPRKITVGS